MQDIFLSSDTQALEIICLLFLIIAGTTILFFFFNSTEEVDDSGMMNVMLKISCN